MDNKTINWTNQSGDVTLHPEHHQDGKKEDGMRQTRIALGIAAVFTTSLGLASCATSSGEQLQDSSRGMRSQAVSQRQAGDLAFEYRQQAAILRQMAQEAEAEARWNGQGSEDRGAVDQKQERARQLWAAAEEVDQLARSYREQVPHGQVY